MVDSQGGETTLSDVNVDEPLTDRLFRARICLSPWMTPSLESIASVTFI